MWWEFPGGPGTKTLCSQCRGPGVSPWSGNCIPHAATKSWNAATKTRDSQINFKKNLKKKSICGAMITQN